MYKPPKNVHHAKTLYGIPRERISAWWNNLSEHTKEMYYSDLRRLGADSDRFEVRRYFFGNQSTKTKRAIARLCAEKHGRGKSCSCTR